AALSSTNCNFHPEKSHRCHGPSVGCVANCALMLISVASSQTPPNFTAIDPAKRFATWALRRADVYCEAQTSGETGSDRWRLGRRADPAYVSCMQQKGYFRVSTNRGPLWDCNPYQCRTYTLPGT